MLINSCFWERRWTSWSRGRLGARETVFLKAVLLKAVVRETVVRETMVRETMVRETMVRETMVWKTVVWKTVVWKKLTRCSRGVLTATSRYAFLRLPPALKSAFLGRSSPCGSPRPDLPRP